MLKSILNPILYLKKSKRNAMELEQKLEQN